MRPSLEDSKNFLSNFSLPEGGFNSQDYYNFEHLILKHAITELTILELGSWTGTSACLLAYYAKNFCGKLFCVDNFKGGENLFNIGNFGAKNILEMHLIYYDLYKYVEIIEADSHIPVNKFPDDYFRIIFIDANHGFDYVKRDIETYLPKLKSGGIMLGHDYGHSSVKDAVQVCLPKHLSYNNIWYYEKETI